VKNLNLHDNDVQSSHSLVSGYGLYDVEGFRMNNNQAKVEGAGSKGCQLYQVADGDVSGNHFKSGAVMARSGFGFGGAINNVVMGFNRADGFVLGKDEIYGDAVITNMKHLAKRTALIMSNGTTITIAKINGDDFIESVVGTATGCTITFKKTVTVRGGMVSVVQRDGNPARYFYNRTDDAAARTIELGIKSADGITDYNLATMTANFDISIME
jgi:hypothetical protein